MFATLVGTENGLEACAEVFDSLLLMAIKQGFSPPERSLSIRENQISLQGWTLELKGPFSEDADFLLAVTAPKIPGIAPIPCEKTIEGPLFAVIVFSGVFIIFSAFSGDVQGVKSKEKIQGLFLEFLERVRTRTKPFSRQ